MKIKEIQQALSTIERYEDDVYDIILCIKVNYEYSKIGYLLRAVKFDSLEKIFTIIVKEYDNCIIEIGQGEKYKSDLYIIASFDELKKLYLKKKLVI